MSSSDASARPAQVTVAGWTVTVASALLLVSAFDALSSLHTVEVRDQLTQAVESGNLEGLGISVSEALTVKRWALYVTTVASVLTGILGVFVLRRDKPARIGVSVGAVPIALAVPLTGSFLAMLVAAGAVVLWSRPARDWFAGRPVTRREPRPSAPPPAPPEPPRQEFPPVVPPTPGQVQPAPTHGWGEAPGSVAAPPAPAAPPAQQYPNPYGQPYTQPYAQPYGQPATQQVPRPPQVRNACLITWIFSGFTALLYLALLVAVAIDQQALIDLVKENPAWDDSYDDDLIVTAAVVGGVLFLLWCVAVAVVAVFTWRGAQWAWITHLVSTGAAAVVALVALPVSVVHLAAIGAVLGMLLRRTSRPYFTKRRP